MSKDFTYCQKNKERVKHFHGISWKRRKRKKKVEVIGKNAVVLNSQTVGHKLYHIYTWQRPLLPTQCIHCNAGHHTNQLDPDLRSDTLNILDQ